MLRRIVWFFVAFPVAILLITLAVANRHGVRLVLDPFRPADPVISLVLPFYAYLFGALLIGVVIGGAATWMTQASWRRNARQRAAEAHRWQAEADRLRRERNGIGSIAATRPSRPLDIGLIHALLRRRGGGCGPQLPRPCRHSRGRLHQGCDCPAAAPSRCRARRAAGGHAAADAGLGGAAGRLGFRRALHGGQDRHHFPRQRRARANRRCSEPTFSCPPRRENCWRSWMRPA